ncbi:MAG: hypothetical protein WCA32_00730 [Chromatiaceae bacterium]|jgi:hypothetical protein
MNPVSAVLPQLLELICDLYEESQEFLEQTGDAQLWYNRGYANGMIDALSELGYKEHVVAVVDPDEGEVAAGHELLPWGKAYRHGWEKGRQETHEVLEGS